MVTYGVMFQRQLRGPMKEIKFFAAMALAALLVAPSGSGANAQDCTAPKAADELSAEEIDALYDCVKASLRDGYKSGDNPIAAAYTDWGATATRPAAPGFHGERFLMTFVNETGFAEYVKFADEGVEMPVGTLIAKESFKLNKENVAKGGPLFTMEKVAAGTADEFDNWVYGGVQPNGKAMKFKQSFCHDCHVGFEGRDNLGYPVEEVRISN